MRGSALVRWCRNHRAGLHLARLNAWSGSVGILWPAIRALAEQTPQRPVKILDIASGAGDVPIGLWQTAHRRGYAVDIEGCDRSPTSVAYAQSRAQHAEASVRFFQFDALTDPIPTGYDVIMCSLFLHHLSEDDATHLLRHMSQATKHLVVINDLIRSWGGLGLAHLATRLLTRSPIVHADGPQSVRAAYSQAEVASLAQRAGLTGATVSWRWPFRFLLTWKQPSS